MTTFLIDGCAFERHVGHLLERHHLTAAPAAVGRHEQRGLRVVDTVAQRLGAEAAEDHRVHGADARAGEHRNRQLGHEREIQRHPVALLHAQRFEDVGKLADLAVEVEVGERAAVARLAFPDDRGLVAARPAHVPIDAVDAGVERPAEEPLGVRRLPLEHLRPRREPLELLGKRRPEGFGIALGASVDVFTVDRRGGAERVGRRKAAVFLRQIGQFDRRVLVSHERDQDT
jgi:hypothetical protein